MRTILATTVLCSLLLTSFVRAEDNSQRIEEVRRQLETLKKQLQELESAAETPNRKIARIGSSGRGRVMADQNLIRVYDLSDLFSTAPTYVATIGEDTGLTARSLFPESGVGPNPSPKTTPMGMGGMGGGGMGMFSVKQPLRVAQNCGGGDGSSKPTEVAAGMKTSIDDLITTIRNSISPDSWKENGGSGTISRIGTSLVVSVDEASHDQIDNLFKLLRQKWGTLRTVSTNVWWLWLNDQQLAKLLPGNGKGHTQIDTQHAYGVVDDAAWKEISAPNENADAKIPGPYRTTITCYNGQTVSFISGSEEGVINDVEPFEVGAGDEKGPRKIGYHPQLTPLHEGAALQMTPLVTTSGRIVVLDIHSRVAIRDSASSARRGGHDGDATAAGIAGVLDRPKMISQRLATTLRVPVDRVMLVGGMTFVPRPQPGLPALYLFVRTTVQDLRDDQPAPAVPTPVKLGKPESPQHDQGKDPKQLAPKKNPGANNEEDEFKSRG